MYCCILSDSLGETGEWVARAAASQFPQGEVVFRRYPHLLCRGDVEELFRHLPTADMVVIYTVVLEDVRKAIVQQAAERGVTAVDVLGPLVAAFAGSLGQEPCRSAGRLHRTDTSYFRRIEAMEFAVKYDDGKDPRGLLLADLVLIGVSRTSKTPLSLYLAQRNLRVANLPLLPEVPPPAELYAVGRGRIVGLMATVEVLAGIRQERLTALGLPPRSFYADPERIRTEVQNAQSLFARLGCPVIDVTGKAVEETAAQVLEVLGIGGHG